MDDGNPHLSPETRPGFARRNRAGRGGTRHPRRVILSAVGSLTQVTLRLANRNTYNTYAGHFEIVSAIGTVSTHGSHLHIAISDGDGLTLGGHLVSGCIIYTTAEIVLAVFPHLVYRRELCALSGYDDLVVGF